MKYFLEMNQAPKLYTYKNQAVQQALKIKNVIKNWFGILSWFYSALVNRCGVSQWNAASSSEV